MGKEWRSVDGCAWVKTGPWVGDESGLVGDKCAERAWAGRERGCVMRPGRVCVVVEGASG